MRRQASRKPWARLQRRELARAGESIQQADSNNVLKAITSLHSELALVKSEICNKIETEISEVTTTLRGEIAVLKNRN